MDEWINGISAHIFHVLDLFPVTQPTVIKHWNC